MPEIVIKYKNPKTLQALKAFAKYFDYAISMMKPEKKAKSSINGVVLLPGDSSIDTSELEDVFTGRGIEAKKLRNEAWQRK